MQTFKGICFVVAVLLFVITICGALTIQSQIFEFAGEYVGLFEAIDIFYFGGN